MNGTLHGIITDSLKTDIHILVVLLITIIYFGATTRPAKKLSNKVALYLASAASSLLLFFVGRPIIVGQISISGFISIFEDNPTYLPGLALIGIIFYLFYLSLMAIALLIIYHSVIKIPKSIKMIGGLTGVELDNAQKKINKKYHNIFVVSCALIFLFFLDPTNLSPLNTFTKYGWMKDGYEAKISDYEKNKEMEFEINQESEFQNWFSTQDDKFIGAKTEKELIDAFIKSLGNPEEGYIEFIEKYQHPRTYFFQNDIYFEHEDNISEYQLHSKIIANKVSYFKGEYTQWNNEFYYNDKYRKNLNNDEISFGPGLYQKGDSGNDVRGYSQIIYIIDGDNKWIILTINYGSDDGRWYYSDFE